MAEKRMFSRKIVGSTKFLKMPATSQLLYFHLCLNADDDGVVEAYSVLLMTGCREDDLRVLVSKKFVTILDEDMVSYINQWNIHNKLRPDRKIDSIYKELLLKVLPDIDLIEMKDRTDQVSSRAPQTGKKLLEIEIRAADIEIREPDLSKYNENRVITHGLSMDCPWTADGPHSIEQIRLDQFSIDQSNKDIVVRGEDKSKPKNILSVDRSADGAKRGEMMDKSVIIQDMHSSGKSITNKVMEYPYVEIIDYLNLITGKSFSCASKDTRKYIKKLIDMGYGMNDFKAVIDKKTAEWSVPEKGKDMRPYLRPSTLFGSNFEAYLNQADSSEMCSNKFNNFHQRKYNYEELEKKLLESDF